MERLPPLESRPAQARRWQLPVGVLAVTALLLLFVPVVEKVAFDLRRYMDPVDPPVPPPPGGAGAPPPVPPILVPTATDITFAPTQVRKGEPLEVRGTVVTANGSRPVAGMPVDLYLNVSKDATGVKVGEGVSREDGTFVITTGLDEVPPADYQLVAGSRGVPINVTHAYGPSWSDPPLRVVSSTTLELRVPPRAAASGPVVVEGRLLDAGGQPVRARTVALLVDGTRAAVAMTSEDGSFTANLTGLAMGPHEVVARFDGTPHLEAAEAGATFEVVDLRFEPDGPVEAVRGEPFALGGRVLLGGEPLAGAAVRVAYGPILLAGPGGPGDLVLGHASEARTDAEGRFRDGQVMGRTQPLGHWSAAVLADGAQLGAGVPIHVVARPNLTLHAPARADTRAEVTVALRDDLGNALAGQPVRVAARRGPAITGEQVVTTGADGTARAVVDVGPLPGTALVEASHPGGGDLLPASASSRLQVAPAPWVTGAALLLAFALGTAGGLAARRASAPPPPRPPGPSLALAFPDLPPWLPAVWAPGEPFRVRVEARDAAGRPAAGVEVRLLAGGEEREVATGPDGAAEATLEGRALGPMPVVATGLRAGWEDARAAAEARLVDYREEVGREYDALRALARRLGARVDRDTAPLELEVALARVRPPPADLDPMLRVFEVAAYSVRPFTRDDYVAYMRHRALVAADLEALPPRARQEVGAGAAA